MSVRCLGSVAFWLLQGQAVKFGIAHCLINRTVKSSWQALTVSQVTCTEDSPEDSELGTQWALVIHKARPKRASLH